MIFENSVKRLQLMSVGGPVDVVAAIQELVPGQCRDEAVAGNETQEGKALVRHYVELVYPVREAVRLQPGPGWKGDERALDAVMWKRSGLARWSQVIQDAADTFWGYYDRPPKLALLQELPKNAPKVLTLSGTCEGQKVTLAAESWVPRGCVIVCGEDMR